LRPASSIAPLIRSHSRRAHSCWSPGFLTHQCAALLSTYREAKSNALWKHAVCLEVSPGNLIQPERGRAPERICMGARRPPHLPMGGHARASFSRLLRAVHSLSSKVGESPFAVICRCRESGGGPRHTYARLASRHGTASDRSTGAFLARWKHRGPAVRPHTRRRVLGLQEHHSAARLVRCLSPSAASPRRALSTRWRHDKNQQLDYESFNCATKLQSGTNKCRKF
jgi:hypothetical protein